MMSQQEAPKVKIIAGLHLMFQRAIKNEQKKILKKYNLNQKSAFLPQKFGTLWNIVEQKPQTIKMTRQTAFSLLSLFKERGED